MIHFVLFVFICFYVQAEILVNVRGPEVFVFGTRDAVTLDCDFYTENFKEFTIRWIYTNDLTTKPQLVYKWKPPLGPQAFGVLKDKIDLSYTVSNNTFTKHRALRLLKPVPEMSGKYTCFVSNSEADNNKTHPMTIFDPEETFDLILHRREDGYLNIMCIVQGIYPKPDIKLLVDNNTLKADTKISLNGTYTALVTTFMKIDDIPSALEILCELKVAGANYFNHVRDTFYKDPLPTIAADLSDTTKTPKTNGTRKTSPALNLTLLLILLFYIV